MEEGTKTKKTVFVGGIGDNIDEGVIFEAFQTFGDILEVQIPSAPINPNTPSETKHRGFAFVTFTSAGDAADAIDNMDGNELRGRVLRVNLARPQKAPAVGLGNRAIWESEEWLQENVKPLAQSGGVGARAALRTPGSIAEETIDDQKNDEKNAMEED